MKGRLSILFAALALVVILALPATASASVTLTAREKAVVAAINKVRADHGLAKLGVKPCLVRAARAHSKEMGANGYFAHESANGESFCRRLVRFGYVRSGYRFWKAGENIAWASDGLFSTAQVVVDNWMHSNAHRAVILTKCFRNIGIGVKSASGYGSVDGKVWFFTLDLGRRIK